MKPDRERVKDLLIDTITLLCKNGLQYDSEIRLQGLLGITLDESEVFLIHLNEKVGILSENYKSSEEICERQPPKSLNRLKKNLPCSTGRPLAKSSPRPLQRADLEGTTSFSSSKIRQCFDGSVISKSSSSQSNLSATLQSKTIGSYGNDVSSLKKEDCEDAAQEMKSLKHEGVLAMEKESSENGNEGRGTVRVKRETDDDIICMEEKPTSDDKFSSGFGSYTVNDDRHAMLGSYVSEPSASEAHLARDIFSEYASITNQCSEELDNSLINSEFTLGKICDNNIGPFRRKSSLIQMMAGDRSKISDKRSTSLGNCIQTSTAQLENFSVEFTDGDLSTATAWRPLRCSYLDCSKRFYRIEHLRRHIRAKHFGTRYSCPHEGCDKSYAYSHMLKLHQNTKHGFVIGISKKSNIAIHQEYDY